jgi:hypothetical protein
MTAKDNSDNGASKMNADNATQLDKLKAEFAALQSKMTALSNAPAITEAPAPAKVKAEKKATPAKVKAEKKAEPAPKAEKKAAPAKGKAKKESDWHTEGRAAEDVQNARLYYRRVSVQHQKNKDGREQVHLYQQILLPADKVAEDVRASLDTCKVKNGKKQVDAYWVNASRPIVIRANVKDAASYLSALIGKAK